ncbi:hypothetical protein ACQ4N7_26375 [Nodosilinea sp. AN01ver1]|uniref:hypothetical protein n=1 Tax=Nodosilinea sp. AN01ver1 TaxID=3423362 RepID=UPI003D320902
MTDSLKAAAKAGDIKALEALMNKSFESKGVTVRVTSSGVLLKIVVRGKELPDQALLPMIQKGLASIAPVGFERATVTARAIGKADAWSHKWDLLRKTKAESQSVADSSLAVSKPAEKALSGGKESKSWYQKNWLVIGLLIFFPLGGIPLAWLSQWPRKNKVGASTASALWLLLYFLIQLLSGTQPRVAQEEPQTPTTELAVAEEVIETTVPAEDRTFADAVNQAMAAAEAAQTAKTSDEWENIANLWTQAINSMKAVPETNQNYQVAQQKAIEYIPNLDHALGKFSLDTSCNSENLRLFVSQHTEGSDIYFIANTNLPDGTEMMFTFSGHAVLAESSKVKVEGGRVRSKNFPNYGREFKGNYNIKVMSVFNTVWQSEDLLPALNSLKSSCISENTDLSTGPAQVLDAEMNFVVGDVEEADRIQQAEEAEARAVFEEASSLLKAGRQNLSYLQQDPDSPFCFSDLNDRMSQAKTLASRADQLNSQEWFFLKVAISNLVMCSTCDKSTVENYCPQAEKNLKEAEAYFE